MNSKTISYAGKVVYIGLDVHKETYAVACIVDNEIVKRASTHADPTSLACSLRNWFEGAVDGVREQIISRVRGG